MECIAVCIGRHVGPVDAAHVFPPSQDLPDKAFNPRKRRMTLGIGVFGCCDNFARVEQLQIQGTGNMGVKKPRLSLPHGVLVQAEMRQPVPDEIIQRLQGLLPVNGPAEGFHRPGVLRKAPVHQSNHFQGDGIGFEAAGRRYHAWALFAKAGPVLGVKVPLPAYGEFSVHENAGFFAHLPVKELHAQLLAALGVLCKIPNGTEKMRVVPYVEGQRMFARDLANRIQHPPFSGRGHDQLVRATS